MTVAIDITAAPPGHVPGVTAELLAALARPGSPARRTVVVARPDQPVAVPLGVAVLADPPGTGRPSADRQRRMAALAAHGVELLHVVGGPLAVVTVDVPIVLSIDGLPHRREPGRFTPMDRGRLETWWTASAWRADAVVVPSPDVRDELRAELGLEGAKVFVCPPDTFRATMAAAYRCATRNLYVRRAA